MLRSATAPWYGIYVLEKDTVQFVEAGAHAGSSVVPGAYGEDGGFAYETVAPKSIKKIIDRKKVLCFFT